MGINPDGSFTYRAAHLNDDIAAQPYGCSLNLKPEGYSYGWATKAQSQGTYPGYEGLTISSTNHTRSSTSRMELVFTLTNAGKISFYWSISSEPSYDKIHVFVDGTVQFSESGYKGAFLWEKSLEAGEHTLKIEYSKDGSGDRGHDTAHVDLITLTGLGPPPVEGFLIREGATFKTYQENGIWADLGTTASKALYENFGMSQLPVASAFQDLADNFEVHWWSSVGNPKPGQIQIHAAPQPVLLVQSDRTYFTESYQKGIKAVTAEYSQSGAQIYLAWSTDNGVTWKAYRAGWQAAEITSASHLITTGTPVGNLPGISEADWDNFLSGATQVKVAIALRIDDRTATLNFKQLKYEYKTEGV